jgi:type IV secretion system protein TrbG
MRKLILVFILVFTANGWGQSNTAPAPVKRIPAPKTLADPTLEKRIESELEVLRQNPLANPGATAHRPRTGTSSNERVSADFKPDADVPLPIAAEAAVSLSDNWLSQLPTPAAGADGRVLYSYGAGPATIVCAPLRICTLELQRGESLVGEPHIGDSVRWNIAPALYGKGESSTTVLVLKPQTSGLDTTLLITTDRRVYYLRLISKPEQYTARVAFAYPDDDQAEQRWKEHQVQQEKQRLEASRIAEFGAVSLESINFNYTVKGAEQIRPMQVFDDGVKTYIRMKPDVRHREAPVLIVVGEDGATEMLNYRVKDDMYIADRLFERARLVLGSGKNAQKVEIIRGTTKN